MQNIILGRSGKRFTLSYTPDWVGDGSLGRGSSNSIYYFNSEEARHLFIAFTQQLEYAGKTISKLDSELRYLKTVKGANANLREVRALRKKNSHENKQRSISRTT